MSNNRILVIRVLLLLLLLGFVAGFALSQYEDVRSMVITICTACIGLGG